MMNPDYDYNFKLSFLSEWFDSTAEQKKQFKLVFYPCDNTIELIDIDLRRTFLKRSTYENLSIKDIFVGNSVTIYGRQIRIFDYADCATEKFIGNWKEHTFAMIKPSGINKMGEIIDEIYKNNFTIVRMRMVQLTRMNCLDFYEKRKGDSFLPFIIEHMSSGLTISLEMVGKDCLERWRSLMGAADPVEARKTDPNCFRARYGVDLAANALHGSSTYDEAVKAACFFFPEGIDRKPPPNTSKIVNCTCCIAKPHAISEGKLGKIITAITDAGFKINALKMYYLTRTNADEFLEVYKGVVADFHALLNTFLDGPCVAMEITSEDENVDVHQEFRKFCGPPDSDVARQIRPRTLRGMFGVDKYKNAVHCTDLPEDTELELEYFFKILDT